MSVSVDAASAAPLAALGAASFLSMTAGANLLLANADEAEVLTARSDPRAAAQALSADYHRLTGCESQRSRNRLTA